MEYEGAAATSTRLTRPKLRDFARLCISTLRAFYVGNIGAAFTAAAPASPATACGGAHGAAPRDPAMGNLQSDVKKKKKGKRSGDGSASTPGSVADGLDETTDTGDDEETEDAEGTPARKLQAVGKAEEYQKFGSEKKLPQKRQAPKPPGFAVRKVSSGAKFNGAAMVN